MSYKITLILSPAFIKSATSIHSNVDDNLLVPIIRDCQKLFIERITGSDLLNEILTQIEGAEGLSDKNKKLLDEYLADAVCRWVTSEYIRLGSHKITNKGTVNMTGDNASISSKAELIELAQDFKNKAEYYGTRATLFLIENEDDYPLYCEGNEKLNDVKPDRDSYETGFVLD